MCYIFIIFYNTKLQDCKYCLTDVCDIEEMFRIIESILLSKRVELIKLWFAKFVTERIDEKFDFLLTLQGTIELYRFKSYDEKNINEKLIVLYYNKNEVGGANE